MEDLKDTKEMMCSPDYKERFKAEYWQLRIRYTKLKAMCKKWDEGKLDFTPTCPRWIYRIQLRAMEDYLTCLEERAKLEKVDLNEVA